MTNNNDLRYICYSLRSNWIRTGRVVKNSMNLPGYVGEEAYVTDFLYECPICHAEFLWKDGLTHKVPFGTLGLFGSKASNA